MRATAIGGQGKGEEAGGEHPLVERAAIIYGVLSLMEE